MELTTSQAVQAYGVYPNVLHRMILMSRLEARKNADGRWLISKPRQVEPPARAPSAEVGTGNGYGLEIHTPERRGCVVG